MLGWLIGIIIEIIILSFWVSKSKNKNIDQHTLHPNLFTCDSKMSIALNSCFLIYIIAI